MVDATPAYRLYWNNGRGVAIGPSGAMTLSYPPDLGFRFYALDYTPSVCATISPEPWHAMRDMYPNEIEACVRFLRVLDAEPDDLQPWDTTTGLPSGMPVKCRPQ